MITVAIANQAGSAGKTTSAVTLAALLAQGGHEVLLLDSDGQANATTWLGVDEPAATLGDVLLRRRGLTLVDAAVETDVPRLRLVPADDRLDADAVELARSLGGEQRLRQALEAMAEQQAAADVTIIDCPGALSIFTIAALVAADSVITVAQPTVKELAGVPKLEGTVEDVRSAYNPKLSLAGVIPCNVPPTGAGVLYAQALALLAENYGDIVTPAVRRSVRVPEAYAQQRPLPVHSPREAVTEDYRAVLDALARAGVLPASGDPLDPPAPRRRAIPAESRARTEEPGLW
ncbi:ParA family protein [Motilibacter aurantiacus]|uniref:ParA family protein n=1 Tax=Motilibacter aurantiacus TaxID=2714955 RepID=UPI0014091386|nr:ParA family protein [Motilibacter aurantiacus]